MTTDYVIYIGTETIKTAIIILAPLLGTGLVVGILVSLFQTVTQIREMTLTLIPKMAAVGLVILLFLPWFIDVVVSFTQEIFKQIPLMTQ